MHYAEIEPVKRMSLLDAPMETPVVPAGTLHLCWTVSHTEKSYRDNCMVTVVEPPAGTKTESKPFSNFGADLAEAGGERYS